MTGAEKQKQMSNQIEEVADKVAYRSGECWECPLYDGDTWCPFYRRQLPDNHPKSIEEQKPDFCRITRIIIEFGR